MAKSDRDEWLKLRVSAGEKARLKSAALDAQLGMSDYIRRLVDHSLSGVQPRNVRSTKRADPQLVGALGRIGNNLNQIARWVNTHKSASESIEVITALSAIERELDRALPARSAPRPTGDDDARPTV